MVQAHIFYSGMVQGVGFRYSAKNFAIDLGVQGWVRNLSDGQVELLAEAENEKVAQLLQQIDEHFKDYITGRKLEYHSSQGQYKNFLIIN